MGETKMTQKQAKAICPKTKMQQNKQPRLKCNKQSNKQTTKGDEMVEK